MNVITKTLTRLSTIWTLTLQVTQCLLYYGEAQLMPHFYFFQKIFQFMSFKGFSQYFLLFFFTSLIKLLQ